MNACCPSSAAGHAFWRGWLWPRTISCLSLQQLTPRPVHESRILVAGCVVLPVEMTAGFRAQAQPHNKEELLSQEPVGRPQKPALHLRANPPPWHRLAAAQFASTDTCANRATASMLNHSPVCRSLTCCEPAKYSLRLANKVSKLLQPPALLRNSWGRQ